MQAELYRHCRIMMKLTTIIIDVSRIKNKLVYDTILIDTVT